MFEALNWVDACSCDWPSRDKKDTKTEEEIYLPPKRDSNASINAS
jgi:hypothetical protein